jgi:hypothetical protein
VTENPVLEVGADADKETNDRYSISFRDRDKMAQAARLLMGCHSHHFDVRPDWQFSLRGLTPMAVECLHDAMMVSSGALETIRKAHAAHLARALDLGSTSDY